MDTKTHPQFELIEEAVRSCMDRVAPWTGEVFLAGVEGILVPSHASPGGGNIAVFPDRLRSGSYVRAL